MTTHVASEDWQYLPPADVEIDGGTGSVEPSDRRLPAGKWHAAEPGSRTTLCGHPIGALYTFPDQPFNFGLTYDRCDLCERRSL